MNFLVDAQLPPALARWIISRGHTATHLLDLGLAASDDSIVWEHARRTASIIISKDEDFVDRWLLNSQGVSLVWVRRGNCSNRALMQWFEPLWPGLLKRLEDGDTFLEVRG